MKEALNTGQELREMFASSTNWLEKSVADIDAINVFPVPDGDTGTNMLFTMRSTMDEAFRAPDTSSASVIKAMAHGALMGARGNSGVILSQIFRGLSKTLGQKDGVDGSDFAEALRQASETAYQGLSRPVEGTILTVIRDAATAAQEAVKGKIKSLDEVMERVVDEAKQSVARTPLLLPVLREAGVVDAGGQGLYVLLEGALNYLRGDTQDQQYRKPEVVVAEAAGAPKVASLVGSKEDPYGYCTEFLITGEKLNADHIRTRLERQGKSLIVVGSEDAVRIHIHTFDPGKVLHYAASLGKLHHLKIENMDDQNVDFVQMQKERTPALDIGIVAVGAGNGIIEVLQSLGVSKVVQGGQTMNPSVRDILQAVEAVPSDKVLVLPNNKNIVLTASQIPGLTKKSVAVVPTRTVAQGIAALLSFRYEGSLEENAKAMSEAVTGVKSVEVTKAVRSTKFKGLRVRRGEYIAIIDDESLVFTGDEVGDVVLGGLEKACAGNCKMITVYYGADTQAAQAEDMIKEIRSTYPQVQIEMVCGGQPHYQYIIAMED
jgi:DAK2 domain fusion protein YloV